MSLPDHEWLEDQLDLATAGETPRVFGYLAGYEAGAAIAFGLMGMAEAIRQHHTLLPFFEELNHYSRGYYQGIQVAARITLRGSAR